MYVYVMCITFKRDWWMGSTVSRGCPQQRPSHILLGWSIYSATTSIS